jgi:hypothetical protein
VIKKKLVVKNGMAMSAVYIWLSLGASSMLLCNDPSSSTKGKEIFGQLSDS